MIRAVPSYVWAILCDVVLLAAAMPLMRYSLAAAHAQASNVPLLLGLLAANLALLAVCLFGMGAWAYAFFHIFRATHARAANEAAAMSKKATVSRSTTPAS